MNIARLIETVLSGGGAAVPWYLKGGIAVDSCLAAYQAQGVASLAASYVNLIDPGTQDAIPSDPVPDWDTLTGWTFDGSTQNLHNTIHNAKTIIIKFTNIVTNTGILLTDDVSNIIIFPQYNGALYVFNGGYVACGLAVTAGTIAVAGTNCYVNGVLRSEELAGVATQAGNITWSSTSACKVQGLAFYSEILTVDQILEVHNAMSNF